MGRAFLATLMSKIKIKLELQKGSRREAFRTIEVASVPRVGEKFETGEQGTFEVVEVVHTPFIREWDAVVILKSAGK
jgi:hypothetical protein